MFGSYLFFLVSVHMKPQGRTCSSEIISISTFKLGHLNGFLVGWIKNEVPLD
jgi:hypothetical protein